MVNKFTILFLLMSIQISAQEGFNNLYTFDMNLAVLGDMILDNDTIIILGGGIIDTSNNQLMYLSKLDTLGNVLDLYTKYNPNGNHYYFWYRSTLIKTSDDGYAICGNASGDISIFAKFSHNFELEFIKEFELEDSNLSFYKELIEIEDGYIIAGDMQKLDFDDMAFVQKLDFYGNQVWYRTFDEPNFKENIKSICKLKDNSLLIGIFDQDSQLMIISEEDGSIIWEDFESEYVYITPVLTPTLDSGFLRGTYISQGSTITDYFVNNRIIKYNKEKEIEWVKTYTDSLFVLFKFDDITATPDGNFVASAWGCINDIGCTSIIWKFDANNGEEIWKYIFPEKIHADQYNSYESYLRSVEVLPSGSIICAGDVGGGGGQKAWIMKLDPQGCYTQDSCATMIVGIDDIISQNLLQPKVISYPDPATDYIQFKTNSGLTRPNEKYKTHIYDISGKTIYKSISSDYLDDIRISVSPFESGVYFYTLSSDKSGVFTGKFVKK